MQVLERFRAQADDGRVVEILKWGARRWFGIPSAEDQGGHIYSTLDGWRCRPTAEGGFVTASGVNVRRVG
jgi:hypothetical protein